MQELIELFKKYDLELSKEKAEQFLVYFKELLEWNEKFNLTAITEKRDVYVKHFLDSAIISKYIPKNLSVVDIGAGAGFPSLPIKILRDDLNITMVDSLNKRIGFLNHMIESLGLKNITAEHLRAEEIKKKYDICIARAVANLSTLLEYAMPSLKVGGKLYALKGSAYSDELENAKNAIMLLDAKLEEVFTFEIEGNERALLVFKKIKETNKKYPRAKNLPRTKPL